MAGIFEDRVITLLQEPDQRAVTWSCPGWVDGYVRNPIAEGTVLQWRWPVKPIVMLPHLRTPDGACLPPPAILRYHGVQRDRSRRTGR